MYILLGMRARINSAPGVQYSRVRVMTPGNDDVKRVDLTFKIATFLSARFHPSILWCFCFSLSNLLASPPACTCIGVQLVAALIYVRYIRKNKLISNPITSLIDQIHLLHLDRITCVTGRGRTTVGFLSVFVSHFIYIFD